MELRRGWGSEDVVLIIPSAILELQLPTRNLTRYFLFHHLILNCDYLILDLLNYRQLSEDVCSMIGFITFTTAYTRTFLDNLSLSVASNDVMSFLQKESQI